MGTKEMCKLHSLPGWVGRGIEKLSGCWIQGTVYGRRKAPRPRISNSFEGVYQRETLSDQDCLQMCINPSTGKPR